MANRNRSTSADGKVASDEGDPNQRSQPEAAHDGSDGTIPVGGASLADRDNVDADRLIGETQKAVDDTIRTAEEAGEPRSEADFGDSGEKRSLKTKGPYMIQDPTTGVEITEDSREVSMSAFLQSKIDEGLVEEA
jgi:hypothetical protein